MNDCVNGEIRDVLPELVSGTLPAGEAARVQEHVRACANCAAEVELLRTARTAMRLAPTMDTTRIAAAVRTSTAQRLAARRAPARVARIASLSLIVVVSAIGLWSMRDSSPATSEPVPVANAGNIQPDVPPVAQPTPAAVQSRGPVQLALGGDMSQLEDDDLLALMEEVSALEAMPAEEAAPLAIEPVMAVDQEDM